MIIFFIIGIAILVFGYIFYSPYVLSQLKLDEKMTTPANAHTDGVDYVPIGTNKNMLVQLLNIAGTGPIYGPIMGALFGPISLILIPIGNVLAGSVMDLGFGVLSLKNKGNNFPILAKKYLGNWSLPIISLFSMLLLVLVATVFVVTPATLFASSFNINEYLWIIISVIFCYYVIATIIPIDKIAARFYPYCTIILLIGTFLTLMSTLYLILIGKAVVDPIETSTLLNWHPTGTLLIPGFIVALSCGFISGFHTTQTPIVAKTLHQAKDSRKVFYGMMTVEGAIAMVWAFVSLVLFSPSELNETINIGTQSLVVNNVAKETLGFLAPLLILIVIIFPITSGDTAFRSLRSILAELFNINQSKVSARLMLCVPIFGCSIFLMTIGYSTLWSYFTWSNHMVSVLTLLMITVYLKNIRFNYFITLIPMIILLFLNTLYILTDKKIGAGLDYMASSGISALITIILTYILLKLSTYWKSNKTLES